jgi:hypothetical protein
MYPSVDQIKNQIVATLPEDGTPVLNRVMLVEVRRAFEASVTPDDYFAAVDLLDKKRSIGRMRGAGGQIYRITSEKPQSRRVSEKSLMAPTHAYLKSEFVSLLELPKKSISLVIDTSKIGPQRGLWARPDFVLVTVAEYKLMPGRHLDVHSFELKSIDGGNVLAVHEALAQTRFTHYGHLVWHLPRKSGAEKDLQEVCAQCEIHGIGLIRAYEPGDLAAGWEVLKTPRRKDTPVGVIDGFLEERVSIDEQKNLLANMN